MKKKMPGWLSNAVFYEIYPQSFKDTNGDGIGDLKGITSKLDYIKGLGCTAIWINPCFVSPFQDAGYDIADYYKVAPRYGSNADLKKLFKEAHNRGMRVILDLVPGHTSIQHPWFKQSCEPKRNKYTDRFIWTDGTFITAMPECRSISGYCDRVGQYVVNFFYSQPALNYGFGRPDPKKKWQQGYNDPGPKSTRAELKKIMRFWLDMGADGFRVDMAASLMKGPKSSRYINKIWREIRQMLDRDYPEAMIVSEWGSPDRAIKAGFHCDFMLHFGPPAYNSLFRYETETKNKKSFFNRKGGGSVVEFVDYYKEIYKEADKKGYICIPSGNHDMFRLGSGRTDADLKVIFAFLLTMPGVPFVYAGDEIGMKHNVKVRSKEGGFERTGARTPMQWDSSKNKGFSKAVPGKLYLPVDKKGPEVEKQMNTEGSLWQTVKRLIALRHKIPALSSDGSFKVLYARHRKSPFVYERELSGQKYIIAVNPLAKKVKAVFPYKKHNSYTCEVEGSGNELKLSKSRVSIAMGPVSYSIYKV
ncbi:MAG: hypothetical protein A2231_02530 [Candidatus Firestonebacteria bacterium RIFOXYA2_FULL_40_8]|nr:MAG: hypothetical protein A2231_02530 [Candidatus Firestonebacteria bacterium RIFOXYA2_FULL_40_8]